MNASRRTDGYAPISDYAALSDGRSVALVASDGQVDWWPVPVLDAPPVCAALLDAKSGGCFSLAPQDPYRASHRYLPGTNVVETTFTTGAGSVLVTDALNVGTAWLPWTELARRVEGLDGQVALRWDFQPGDRFGQARPWVIGHGQIPVVADGGQNIALIVDGAEPARIAGRRVGGTIRTVPGQRSLVAAVATDHEPVVLPEPAHIDGRLDRTIESWRRWTGQIGYDGPWAGAVERSALALKTLLYEAGGAIAAAATTSLPEAVSGHKNYDYRYAWVRDSSFTLNALIGLGLHEEAHAALSWLLQAVRRTAPDIHVFYSLDGEVTSGTQADLGLPGYRNSAPVRSGNGAAAQAQLGTHGDLLDTVFRYVTAGHVLDDRTGRMLADLADRCCDIWMHQDAGLWELPQYQHYTSSKIGCWTALDRAARLAESGQLPCAHAPRWRQEADDIREWVRTHCWSQAKQSYTFYAGSDELDAAVLLAGRTGFDRGERLATTAAALRAELGEGAFLYRYTGMPGKENAFVVCTFWLVEALALTGQREEAAAMMDEAVSWCGDAGLLSEQIDPRTGELFGNLPQGLSHLGLINAALTLSCPPASGPGQPSQHAVRC